MKKQGISALILMLIVACYSSSQGQISPADIKFVRQGVKRLIFNEDQSIPLANLNPENIIGLSAMHPVRHYMKEQSEISIQENKLVILSHHKTQTSIWFGGFNPFATFMIDLASCTGDGEIGFEFSDSEKKEQFILTVGFKHDTLTGVTLKVIKDSTIIAEQSVTTNIMMGQTITGKIILQMLGSGFTLYLQDKGLPIVIGQNDFNKYMDLRKKWYMRNFQSNLYAQMNSGKVVIKRIESMLSTGVGLADIRAITYENGDPLLDQGRLWYTMSIRGRALPHHIQGVFSMDPTIFDIRLEGIIVFDRGDGLLRNEIASHIYYNRHLNIWRGLTTGFSAYANLEHEKKQLLAIESHTDPRFGFSIMHSEPFGMVGDIEDPHILFDSAVNKWRMLTCVNQQGYKAIMMESSDWNKGYKRIAGPVNHNSTGTSTQRIGDQFFCFSGSSEREIFIYTYPDLKKAGTLIMDLPPWDETSGTRVWPNVVQLPEGYPFRYVALMMDRYNYPDLQGPNWSYGALYLYHGYE